MYEMVIIEWLDADDMSVFPLLWVLFFWLLIKKWKLGGDDFTFDWKFLELLFVGYDIPGICFMKGKIVDGRCGKIWF